MPVLTSPAVTGSSNSGFIELGNKSLILQFGQYSLPVSGTATISYPVRFPTACLNVIGTPCNNASPNSILYTLDIDLVTKTGFDAYAMFYNTSGPTSGTADATFNWIAIGY